MPLSDNGIVSEQIVEIRFRALGRIMDMRGLIADKISEQMNLSYWAITDNRVDFKISESTDREKAYVSHHNLGYIVRNSDTRTYFPERAMKFIRELNRIEGFELREIRRFGVRVKFLALLPSEWVIMGCFSDGLEHTGQDFQTEILLIA